jgi:hypothetical protein
MVIGQRLADVTKEHVLEKMQRLKNLGLKLLSGASPSQDELKYIGEVLVLIGDGADPNDVLGIKGSGGWNSKKDNNEKNRLNRVKLAIAWMEHSMKPEPDGLGYKVEDAARAIAMDNVNPTANHFGFKEEHLKRMWNRYKELKGKPLTLLDLNLLQ